VLILKAYVNEKLIDEIHVQNTGERDSWGQSVYKIRKPEIAVDILHHRTLDWKVLAQKVLDELYWQEEGSNKLSNPVKGF